MNFFLPFVIPEHLSRLRHGVWLFAFWLVLNLFYFSFKLWFYVPYRMLKHYFKSSYIYIVNSRLARFIVLELFVLFSSYILLFLFVYR